MDPANDPPTDTKGQAALRGACRVQPRVGGLPPTLRAERTRPQSTTSAPKNMTRTDCKPVARSLAIRRSSGPGLPTRSPSPCSPPVKSHFPQSATRPALRRAARVYALIGWAASPARVSRNGLATPRAMHPLVDAPHCCTPGRTQRTCDQDYSLVEADPSCGVPAPKGRSAKEETDISTGVRTNDEDRPAQRRDGDEPPTPDEHRRHKHRRDHTRRERYPSCLTRAPVTGTMSPSAHTPNHSQRGCCAGACGVRPQTLRRDPRDTRRGRR
jgi:hypothetical protein